MGVGGGSNSQRRKAAYDPQRKWGLTPAEGGNVAPSPEVDGATYIVAGHVVAGGKRDLFVNESVGREAQARAARKASSRDTDAALKRLLARDKEGMKAVQKARKFAKNVLGKQNGEGKALGKGESSREKRRKREGDDVSDGDSDSESGIDGGCASESDGDSGDKPTKNAYSARVIKELGFDPTALKSSRDGRRKDDDSQSIYSKVRLRHIPFDQSPILTRNALSRFIIIFISFSTFFLSSSSCQSLHRVVRSAR